MSAFARTGFVRFSAPVSMKIQLPGKHNVDEWHMATSYTDMRFVVSIFYRYEIGGTYNV